MKSEEGSKEKEGTFKYFQGKFSSLYEKMGQKFKGLLALKNEFVVEDNEMDDESLLSSTFPDFDPSKFDNESNIISETTDRKFKLATNNIKSDEEVENFQAVQSPTLIMNSNNRQLSLNESK